MLTFLVIATAITSSANPVALGLVNADLETGNISPWQKDEPYILEIWSTDNVRSGIYCGRLMTSYDVTNIYQDITDVTAGDKLTFGGWARQLYTVIQHPSNIITAAIEFGTGATYNPAEIIGSRYAGGELYMNQTYLEFDSTEITAPSGALSARVILNCTRGDSFQRYFYFDDCYLKKDGVVISEFSSPIIIIPLVVSFLAVGIVHRRRK